METAIALDFGTWARASSKQDSFSAQKGDKDGCKGKSWEDWSYIGKMSCESGWASPIMEPSFSLHMYRPPAVTCNELILASTLMSRLGSHALPPLCRWRERTWALWRCPDCLAALKSDENKDSTDQVSQVSLSFRSTSSLKTCPGSLGLQLLQGLQGCFTPATMPGLRPKAKLYSH